MKLKTWLLMTFFIVMVLPLIAAYILFAWIQSYHNEQKVSELFEKTIELKQIKQVLDDPVLYYPSANKQAIDQLVNEQRSITLYNQNGLVLYSSNPTTSSINIQKERLYENLYKIEQQFSTYSLKQPVFQNSNVVGFFHIELARNEWVGGVADRSIWLIISFISLFICIYFVVIRLVNRKLTRPLLDLMNEMTAFASGHTVSETPTNNDEIGKLKRHFYEMRNEINRAQKIIQEKQAEKEYMIASVSHDLKTPLTSITAYTEALDVETGLTEGERQDYRKVIMEKSNFMKQMLDDLLTFTLLQSPTHEIDFVHVDGSEFFEMLVSDYDALCRRKEIELDVFSNISGTYKVNPKQMMRVADNLMSNAIQHTAHGNEIWLAAICHKDDVPNWLYSFVDMKFNFDKNMYLIIQNEGKGITKEKITSIFEPLYQVDLARSKRDAHGTGLGLSITKQIMEKHDGDVQLFSEHGTGTCVICRLPKDEE